MLLDVNSAVCVGTNLLEVPGPGFSLVAMRAAYHVKKWDRVHPISTSRRSSPYSLLLPCPVNSERSSAISMTSINGCPIPHFFSSQSKLIAACGIREFFLLYWMPELARL